MDKIGGFSIIEKLGDSDFADIYRVSVPEARGTVIKAAKEPTPFYNHLIAREYYILSKLQHPNIILPIRYDIDIDGRSFILLNYVPGLPINECFKGYSQPLMCSMTDLLSAIIYIHNAGYIHGDLKPSHIRYDAGPGKTVLLDFGFSGANHENEEARGTLGYAAPEILKGRASNQRSDIYSLGMILAEIIGGIPAAVLYDRQKAFILKRRHSLNPVDVLFKDLDAPEEIQGVLAKMLSIEPALRPSAGEVYETFIRCTGRSPVPAVSIQSGMPPMPFIDIAHHFDQLIKVDEIVGKTHIITGSTGMGKTYLLNELQYAYRLSGADVIDFKCAPERSLSSRLCEYCERSNTINPGSHEFSYYESIVEHLGQKQQDRQRSLIIIVDGLQDINAADKKFFRYLGLSLRDGKIGLIAAGLNCDDFVETGFIEIKLSAMNRQDMHSLVCAMFGEHIDDESFLAWLYQVTGGVPLFLQAVIGLLVNNGAVCFKNGKWILDGDKYTGIPYPKQISELLVGKINSLDDPSRDLIELICSIDHPLEPFLIAEIVKTPYDMELSRLIGDGLITDIQVGDRPAFEPSNRIVKEIVMRSADGKKTSDFKKKIFSILIKWQGLNPHYYGFIAKTAGAANAWREGHDYACRAGELEENKHNILESIQYYQAALDYATKAEIDHRYCLLVKIGELYLQLGDTRESLECYRQAAEYSRNDDDNAKILHRLGYVQQIQGRYNESLSYFQKALPIIPRLDPLYPVILGGIGYDQIQLKNYKQAEKIIGELNVLADDTGSLKIKYRVLYLSGVLHWFKGELDRSIEAIKNALPVSERLDQISEVALNHNLMASIYQQQGKSADADDSFQKAIAIYEQMKDLPALTNATINRALGLKNQCRFEEALNSLDIANGYANKIGNHKIMAIALMNIANIHEIKGDFSNALDFNRKSVELSSDIPKSIYNICMLLNITGKIKESRKFQKLLMRSDNSSLYHVFKVDQYGRLNKSAGVKNHIEIGMETIGEKKKDMAISVEFYMKAVAACFNVKLYADCLKYASEAKKCLPAESREYAIVDGMAKIGAYCLQSSASADVGAEQSFLKDHGCLYDWAVLKRMEIEAVAREKAVVSSSINFADLSAAEEIFNKAGDIFELRRLREARAMINNQQGINDKTGGVIDKYLNVFNAISDLLNMHLGESDFTDKLLDVVLTATGAERGALFFVDEGEVKFVAGRNVDKKTIADAKKISSSVINEAHSTMELIESNDVLHDERFLRSRSVIINKIRSLLCVPLRINCQVVGVIYLDNTYERHVFSDEDRNFLRTVANFLAATIDKSQVFQRLKRENAVLQNGAVTEIADEYLVGNSPGILSIRETIDKIAGINSTVLLIGETGCGKGIVARLIHQRSARKVGRFVSINCGAFPETLFEAELFGYRKGAFTGASNNRRGLFIEADRGTLFLDEISNAPILVQGKLLEALEDKQIRRLGENLVHKVDVRLICATNQDLERLVRDGQFRIDLYYRISVLTIFIPPLRKRSEDIPLLAEHFLKKYARELNPAILGFDQKAIRTMVSYPWPGNVRELQNSIERAVIYARGNYIGIQDLQLKSEVIDPIRMKNEDQDRILAVLHSTKCNITMTAKLLGISRTTLYSYIKKFGIDVNEINDKE